MCVHVLQGEVEVLGVYRYKLTVSLIGVFFEPRCIPLVREKLTVFPYGQYIVGNDCSLAF